MSLTRKVGMMTLGQGINVVVNILFLPYMARALSYEEYGSYGQALLVTSVVATFLTLGLPQLLNVYLADDRKDNRTSLSNNLFTSLLLGLVGAIITYLTADWFGSIFDNTALPYLLKILSLSILFSIPFASLNSFFIYTGKVKLSVILSVLTNILKIILVVLSIQFFKSLPLALASMVLISFLQLVIALLYARKALVYQFNSREIKQQILEGFPLGMTGVIAMVILYTDSTMISVMLDIKEYAIYRNGAIEVPFVSTLYGSIAAIVLPEVAKFWQKGKIDELFQLKKKVIMNTIYLLYPILIFLIFNAQSIITLYLGDKYADSAVVFAVFNLTLLIRVNYYADVLISAKMNKYILKVYLFVVLFNFIFNYFLINIYGSVGAAGSTVLSIAVLSALLLRKTLIISNKKLKDLVESKKIFIVLLSTVSVGFFMYFITKPINNEFIKLLTFFFGYTICIVLFFNHMNYFSKEIYLSLIPSRLIPFFNKKSRRKNDIK